MIVRVIQDISRYLTTYSDNAIVVAGVFAAIKFLGALFYMADYKKSVYWRMWVRTLVSLPVDFLVAFYVYMVIMITVFSRMEGSTDIVNLRLFSTFADNLWSKTFVVENILLFIPMGCFLWWYGLRRYRMALFLPVIASVLIEIAQFVTRRGKVELDDVLTNTFGAVIGFTVMKAIEYVVTEIRMQKYKHVRLEERIQPDKKG